MNNPLPISTFFAGILGFIAIALSYIVVIERTKNRVWHGESKADVSSQPNYLENPGSGCNIVPSANRSNHFSR
ncbi:MAPEG family protein [Pleurocapsales cyanobacterium LEGE 10410]|nr:MAPEG family protein [Pleurocapsales cyanobacterium LEGE 10410]